MDITPRPATVFSVDANFIIQCKPPNELNWGDVTPADDIILLVTRTVQHEIDRLKQDGNSRRSRKARTFSSLMREMIGAEGFESVARAGAPTVRYRLAPRLNPNRAKPPELDLSIPDDRLVEETLAASAVDGLEDVAVLTHDTGPQLTALHAGVPFVAIPDSWLLEPEPSAASKSVAALERRISLLERSVPEIELALEGWVASDGPLKLSWNQYGNISDELSERFVAWMLETNPYRPLSEPRVAFDRYVSVGSESRRNRDYQEEYDAWKEKLPAAFQRIARHIVKYEPAPTSAISIKNSGSVPAENLSIEISVRGALLESPKIANVVAGRKAAPDIKLPPAPTPPERYSLLNPSFGMTPYDGPTLAGILRDQKTDRATFYWKPERPKNEASLWHLECEEFRHKMKPKVFSLRIKPDGEARSGTLSVTAHASNLPDPVSLLVPFKMSVLEGDMSAAFTAWAARSEQPEA
jgi:hypothetical protein